MRIFCFELPVFVGCWRFGLEALSFEASRPTDSGLHAFGFGIVDLADSGLEICPASCTLRAHARDLLLRPMVLVA